MLEELVQGDGCGGISPRQQQQKALTEDFVPLETRGILERLGTDYHVYLMGEQGVTMSRREAGPDHTVAHGASKLDQQLSADCGGQRIGKRETQSRQLEVHRLAHPSHGLLRALDQPTSMICQNASRQRNVHRAHLAIEQPDAKRTLHASDRLTDRGLAHAEDLGGLRHSPSLDDAQEYLQRAEIEGIERAVEGRAQA